VELPSNQSNGLPNTHTHTQETHTCTDTNAYTHIHAGARVACVRQPVRYCLQTRAKACHTAMVARASPPPPALISLAPNPRVSYQGGGTSHQGGV